MFPEAASFKKKWQRAQRKLYARGEDDCSYLYVHTGIDSSDPFYVGIGYTVGRPWETRDRSDEHRRVTSDRGMRVSVLHSFRMTWEQACFWEIRWIKALQDAGYALVNLTTGGEGAGIMRESTKEKLRIANLGKKYSQETNAKKGRTGPKLSLTDEGRAILKRPKSEEARQKMSATALVVQGADEQRAKNSAGCKRHYAALSVEEKSKKALKGWETRRRNALLKKGEA